MKLTHYHPIGSRLSAAFSGLITVFGVCVIAAIVLALCTKTLEKFVGADGFSTEVVSTAILQRIGVGNLLNLMTLIVLFLIFRKLSIIAKHLSGK